MVVKKPVCDNRWPMPRLCRLVSATSRIAAVLACVLLSACYWLRYPDLVQTHAELMERMAIDAGAALDTPDQGLAPSDIERMSYPLDRAKSFAEISERHFGERASLEHLRSLIEAYADLVGYLDRVRSRPVGERERDRARGRVARVSELAAEVRRALQAESRG